MKAILRDSKYMEKVKISIEGMHCGSCASSIEMLLGMKEGVSKASVSYDDKKGELEYDPEKATLEDLLKDIHDIGYTATKVS